MISFANLILEFHWKDATYGTFTAYLLLHMTAPFCQNSYHRKGIHLTIIAQYNYGD